MKSERKTNEAAENTERLRVQCSTGDLIRPRMDSCSPKYSERSAESIPAEISPWDEETLSGLFMPRKHSIKPYGKLQ